MFLLALTLATQVAAQKLTSNQEKRAEFLLAARLPCRGCHVIGGKGGRIGPVLDGVTGRRSLDYVQNMVADPQRLAPGTPMPRVIMTERDRALVIAYITSRPSAVGSQTAQRRTNLRTAEELYVHYCAACHGSSGQGDGPNARHLPIKPAVHADGKAMATRTDDRLYDGIHAGGIVLGKSPFMPGFGQTLTHDQIRALVAHIRKLCKCRQPKWAE